jgi:ankyrin repeat protein
MKNRLLMILTMGLLIALSGCRAMTMTPLSKASSRGDIPAMNDLIQKGANLNEPAEKSYKATALHWAASYGRAEAAEALLKAGANANSLDFCNQTPIYYAINAKHKNSATIVKYLISYRAELNFKDCNDLMPIDYASRNQDLSVVEMILSRSPESAEKLKK